MGGVPVWRIRSGILRGHAMFSKLCFPIVAALGIHIGLALFPLGWAGAELIDRVVAVVNGEPITLSEVQELGYEALKLLRDRTPRDEQSIGAQERKVLDALITRKLQLQDAVTAGLTVPDSDVESAMGDIAARNKMTMEELTRALEKGGLTIESYKENLREQILLEKVVQLRVRSALKVRDEELRQYYEANAQSFVEGEEKVRLAQILLSVPAASPEGEVQAVRRRAEEILDSIRKGGDFAEMAKVNSQGQNADQGGEVGTFRRGEVLPELEEVVFGLQAGEVSEVVRSPLGFHILYVLERWEPRQLSLEEATDAVLQAILSKRFQERMDEWTQQLKEGAAVEILY